MNFQAWLQALPLPGGVEIQVRIPDGVEVLPCYCGHSVPEDRQITLSPNWIYGERVNEADEHGRHKGSELVAYAWFHRSVSCCGAFPGAPVRVVSALYCAWIKSLDFPERRDTRHYTTISVPNELDFLPCGCAVPEDRQVVLTVSDTDYPYYWAHQACEKTWYAAPHTEMPWYVADSRGLLGHF